MGKFPEIGAYLNHCMNVSVAIPDQLKAIEVSALISCIAYLSCLYEISTQN
jgi:hypothetical protein